MARTGDASVESKACPCCSGELHRIGEDVAERLDIIPAQFRVLVTRRPKYACRACEEGVVHPPPAPQPPSRSAGVKETSHGGFPVNSSSVHVVVSSR